MDKKSDTPMLASGAAPGLSPSSRPAAYVAPSMAPVEPAAPGVAPRLPVEDHWDEGRLEEAIFRPTRTEDGELVIRILPPTLYNLTHPKEEDDVSQGNRHYRTLDPVDDILRRKLERKRPGVGVFSELMFYWPDPALEPSCPDVCVVEGLRRPAEEIGNSFDVAKEGVVPSLVFEIVSATYKSTRDKDYEFNPRHYAKAGVKELVLVEPVTQGSPEIRRVTALELDAAGSSKEIKPDVSGRILLKTVGFHVHVEKAAVVLEDARTHERFLTSWEEEEARRAADLRTVAEASARQEAERRAAAEATARQEAEHRAAQAAEALAETLLDLLGNRALPLPDADRQRILECNDSNQLQRWLRRAFKVDTVDELWDKA